MILKDGKPILAVSVAGGDLQDQTTLNLFLDFVEFGMMPAEAVIAPRFSTSHHQNSFDPNPARQAAFLKAASLNLNADINQQTIEELANRGHTATTTNGRIASPVMLYIDGAAGMLYTAGDPGAGRHAAALD
jgi:gamma-glutamyltranspeptidase/glutathione hydrolase